MPDGEPCATSHHPLAGLFRRELERVEHDLLAVVARHLTSCGSHLVVCALVETTGTLAERLVEADPETRAHLLARLDQLRLYIAATGQPAH